MTNLASALLAMATLASGHPVRHVRDHGGAQYVSEVAAQIEVAAHAHGVDPYLLGALALSESGLDWERVGTARETGLLQLHPGSRWGRAAARDCRAAPGLCGVWISSWWGAEALRHGLAVCGTETAAVGWYKSGRCIEGPKARWVVALRDRMRGGDV